MADAGAVRQQVECGGDDTQFPRNFWDWIRIWPKRRSNTLLPEYGQNNIGCCAGK